MRPTALASLRCFSSVNGHGVDPCIPSQRGASNAQAEELLEVECGTRPPSRLGPLTSPLSPSHVVLSCLAQDINTKKHGCGSWHRDTLVDLPTSLALQCLRFPESFTSWWVLGSWVEYLQNMHCTQNAKTGGQTSSVMTHPQ